MDVDEAGREDEPVEIDHVSRVEVDVTVVADRCDHAVIGDHGGVRAR